MNAHNAAGLGPGNHTIDDDRPAKLKEHQAMQPSTGNISQCASHPSRVTVLAVRTLMLTWTLVVLPAAVARGGDETANSQSSDLDLAIDGGLQWLADTQIKDGGAAGSWPSQKFPTAVTSLAGLAFLANGHLPGNDGPHGSVVDAATKYVQSSMTGDGYAGSIGDSMYVHAICTLFVLSYLGMDQDAGKDAETAEWCRRAVELIVNAQAMPKPKNHKGGWRYSPRAGDSDLSVTSWQMLVLYAARQCGYTVDDSVIDSALGYVNSGFVRTEDSAAGFVYQPGRDTTPKYGLTGTILLVKSLFEDQVDEKMTESLAYMQSFKVGWGGPQYGGFFFCNTLYLTQGFFQMGGREYDEFAEATTELLLEHQKGDGHWPYPFNNGAQNRGSGEAYPTAMAVLILSLHKQNLPVFQRQRSFYR